MQRALQLAKLAIVLGLLSIVLALVSIVMAVNENNDDNPSHWGWVRCMPFEIGPWGIGFNVCTGNAGTFWVNGQPIGQWNGPTAQRCFAIDTREATYLFRGQFMWTPEPSSICR